MFPQEWPALFSVAAVASVIDIFRFEQKFIVAVMGVMAVAAGHAAETKRVPGCLITVRAGPRMAVEADFLLLQGIKNRVTFGMYAVTGNAGEVSIFM